MPIAEGARRVRGVGPAPSKVAFYGEAPGKMENYRGVPFIGKAGMVLRSFATWHGLDVDANFIGNVCQYWPGRDRYPTPGQIVRRGLEAVGKGGRVGIIHYAWPRPPKNARPIACIGVIAGYDNRMRCFSVFEALS